MRRGGGRWRRTAVVSQLCRYPAACQRSTIVMVMPALSAVAASFHLRREAGKGRISMIARIPCCPVPRPVPPTPGRGPAGARRAG